MSKTRHLRLRQFVALALLLTTTFLILPIKPSRVFRTTVQNQFNRHMIPVVYWYGDLVQDPDSTSITPTTQRWYEWHVSSLVSTGYLVVFKHTLVNISEEDYFEKYDHNNYEPTRFDVGFSYDPDKRLVVRVRCRPEDVPAWKQYFEDIEDGTLVPIDPP